MKQGMVGLACMLMAFGAFAGERAAVLKRAEASMLVSGSIELAPDGSVRNYTLDKPDKLPPLVLKLVQQNVPVWKLSLKDDESSRKAGMNLRIIATHTGDHNYAIRISAAEFSSTDAAPGQAITYKSNPPPDYPFDAVISRISGTVYVLLQIGRDGTVKDALTEQVNLNQYASEKNMTRFRNDLAKASLAAIRHWTFNPPTTGNEVKKPFWYARVPVEFDLSSTRQSAKYGTWNAYIPGPREPVPASWTDDDRLLSGSPDATPDGTLDLGNSNLKLLTSLSGS